MKTKTAQRFALICLVGLAVIVAATQLAACGGGYASSSGPSVTVFDESYDFSPGGEIVASLGSADLEVRTGSRSGARVIVEGSEDEFERARFTVTYEDGRLMLATNPRRNSGVRMSRGLTITVEVPEDVSVNAEVGSGEVTIGTVRGAIAIETGSGDVETQDVGAAAEVETGSGSVSVGVVAGGVDISTGSGDVSFSVSRSAPISVETGSGDVEGAIPADAGFSIGIGTGSGEIDIDSGLDFDGRTRDRSAEGDISGGGPPLRVSTGSGDVSIRIR